MDQKREVQWLTDYLEQLLQKTVNAAGFDVDASGEVRIPAYTREAYNRSCAGVGDTYIEVDMGIQKLYYYEAGELKLETDIVTGNVRKKMNTPEGVNYVYSKQKNRILRGEGYTSPVSFWMPVKGAVGIHDASWRDEFGGDIYKSNGSHGCINLPSDVMAELYDMVEVGTPVVMFYGEEPENTADMAQTK
jgi:lipoprotein-anchoring transpeptidase ErfK/SrfK